MRFKHVVLMCTTAVAVLAACETGSKQNDQPMNQKITKESWGEADGKPVDLYTLTNANGVQVKITNYDK